MITKTGVINRQGWPKGPWDDEPDWAKWTTPSGSAALIRRNEYGSLFGLVAAPRDMIRRITGDQFDDADRSGYFRGKLGHSFFADGWIVECWVRYSEGLDRILSWSGVGDSGYWLSFCQRDPMYRTFEYMKSECDELAAQIERFRRSL